MTPFLEQLAQSYYKAYAKDLSDFAFVFPNRRAGLFFRKALAKASDKPLFAPDILGINDLFFQESNLLQADKITLLFTLYKSYTKVVKSDESFDTFLFFGDMLLADFNDIDKYMADAKQVFQNIKDIKDIESDFSWMSDDQKAIIRQFWGYFLNETGRDLETQFVEMWTTLFDLYTTFKNDLQAQGIGYDGMIFRNVVEKQDTLKNCHKRVIFVGFNALTKTEEALFKKYQKLGIGDYYFDYQSPEIKAMGNVANQFIKENESIFHAEFELDQSTSETIINRQIELIAIPSDIGQTKQVYNILEELQRENSNNIGLKTAIVLPDEKLLIPMLHAIPESVKTVNITMGYPLSLTPIAALMDHIAALQKNSRLIEKKPHFYYKHVLAILNHPYIFDYAKNDVEIITEKIRKENLFLVSPDELCRNDLFNALFTPISETSHFIDYFSKITTLLSNTSQHDSSKQLDAEYFANYQSAINRLEENLKQTNVPISSDTFFKLLKQLTSSINIAFKGEPVEGLQIMGTLETRALDFDNLIITSFNEGIFPRKNSTPSVIPYSLRRAFGLPTYEYHDAIFAYNFYRMIYRSKRVFLLYDSRSDGQHGELSRYAAQLEYLYNLPLIRKSVSYSVSSKKADAITIEKDERILERLNKFTQKDSKKAISASDINNYIDCPLRFYFSKIEELGSPDTVSETIESNTFGSLFHKVMELLYEPYKGKLITKAIITELIGNTITIDTYIHKAFNEIFYKSSKTMPILGHNLLIANIIKTYVLQTLQFDQTKRAPFDYIDSELRLNPTIELGNGLEVNLKGFIDRVDEQTNITHIVDYKTGKVTFEFSDISTIFDNTNATRPKAILQTFFYAMLYQMERSNGKQIKPVIYSLRDLKNYQIIHKPSKEKLIIEDYRTVKEEFEAALKSCLVTMFDPKEAFTQCNDVKQCEFCNFRTICNR